MLAERDECGERPALRSLSSTVRSLPRQPAPVALPLDEVADGGGNAFCHLRQQDAHRNVRQAEGQKDGGGSYDEDDQ